MFFYSISSADHRQNWDKCPRGCEGLMIGGIWPGKADVLLAARCHNRPFADSVRGDRGGSVLGAFPVNHHPPPRRSEMTPFQSVDVNPAGSSSLERHAQHQPHSQGSVAPPRRQPCYMLKKNPAHTVGTDKASNTSELHRRDEQHHQPDRKIDSHRSSLILPPAANHRCHLLYAVINQMSASPEL